MIKITVRITILTVFVLQIWFVTCLVKTDCVKLSSTSNTKQPQFPQSHLDLYRRGFQSSVDHGQHAVLNVLCRCLGQQ